MTLDDLPFEPPASPASGTGAKGRECRRHRYEPTDEREWTAADAPVTVWRCVRCAHKRSAENARRGKSSLRAGKDAERAIAAAYGGERVGQHGGPADVIVGELFIVQSKAGKGWYRQAVVDELDKLPRTGGLIPTLVVSDRPGPGHRTRRYVVRLMEDDIALHGRQP